MFNRFKVILQKNKFILLFIILCSFALGAVIAQAYNQVNEQYDISFKSEKSLDELNNIITIDNLNQIKEIDIQNGKDRFVNIDVNKLINNKDIKIFKVSAATNKGLTEVIDALAEILDNTPDAPLFDEDDFESHVLYKFKREEPYTITHDEEDLWTISGKEIEKLFKMTKFSSEEGMLRFTKKLRRMGIDDKLRELGAKEGDQVRILDFYFDYKD